MKNTSPLALAIALVAIATQSFANGSFATQEGENVTEAQPLLARATQRGGLSFSGAEIDVVGIPRYFDCVTDPLIAASDRASVCLFLGAAAPSTGQTAPGAGRAAPLVLDRERGSMALDTPRTCGGFAESGRLDAGPLSFEIVPASAGGRGAASSPAVVPATLWASSLDGKPLAESSRILLTHLTDVQGKGAQYADDSRKILIKWGSGCLIEVGAADVELRLAPRAAGDAGARPPAVWALDTAGNRVAELPATFEDGALRFRACTRGPDGTGRIYYEIAQK